MDENTLDPTRQLIRDAILQRRAKGETLEQISDSIGVHWTTVWKWEQGRDIRSSAISLLRLVVENTADSHQSAA